MKVKSYYDEDLGLSLEMPKKWMIVENEHIPLVIAAPPEKKFQANMTFVMRDIEIATPEAMQVVVDSARSDRMESYDNFELVQEERLIIDNSPAHLEHYHWTMDNTGLPLTQLFALIFIGNDMLFSIHATCLRKLEEKYLPRFEHVVKSLRFTNAEGLLAEEGEENDEDADSDTNEDE